MQKCLTHWLNTGRRAIGAAVSGEEKKKSWKGGTEERKFCRVPGTGCRTRKPSSVIANQRTIRGIGHKEDNEDRRKCERTWAKKTGKNLNTFHL